MESYPVTIRRATPDDVKYLVEFTKEDGWEFSEFDCKADLAIDPDFLICATDSSGTPVGFGGIIRCDSETFYLDNYIVRKDHRHKGIGTKIWKAMLQRTGTNNICLDSVSRTVEWYRKKGFIYESFKLDTYVTVTNADMKISFQSPYNVLPLSEDMWPKVMDYDKQVFPDFDREKIVRAWCHGTITGVAFAEGSVVGYGCICKKDERVYSFRNLFGDNEHVIEAIMSYLMSTVPGGSKVFFAILSNKPVPNCLNSNRTFLGTLTRMFNKATIKVNDEKIWIHRGTKI